MFLSQRSRSTTWDAGAELHGSFKSNYFTAYSLALNFDIAFFEGTSSLSLQTCSVNIN